MENRTITTLLNTAPGILSMWTKFSSWEKKNCMHLAREKTHLSSRTFELKTKSMAGEGGGYSNELKYLNKCRGLYTWYVGPW